MLFLDVAWLSHAHKLTPAVDRANQNSSADGTDDRQTPCVTKKLLAADGCGSSEDYHGRYAHNPYAHIGRKG